MTSVFATSCSFKPTLPFAYRASSPTSAQTRSIELLLNNESVVTWLSAAHALPSGPTPTPFEVHLDLSSHAQASRRATVWNGGQLAMFDACTASYRRCATKGAVSRKSFSPCTANPLSASIEPGRNRFARSSKLFTCISNSETATSKASDSAPLRMPASSDSLYSAANRSIYNCASTETASNRYSTNAPGFFQYRPIKG